MNSKHVWSMSGRSLTSRSFMPLSATQWRRRRASAFNTVVCWRKLGEVENESTSRTHILCAIRVPKIIKFGRHLTNLWQKQFCTVFFETRCIYNYKYWSLWSHTHLRSNMIDGLDVIVVAVVYVQIEFHQPGRGLSVYEPSVCTVNCLRRVPSQVRCRYQVRTYRLTARRNTDVDNNNISRGIRYDTIDDLHWKKDRQAAASLMWHIN